MKAFIVVMLTLSSNMAVNFNMPAPRADFCDDFDCGTSGSCELLKKLACPH